MIFPCLFSLSFSQHPEFEPESFNGIVVCEKPNNNLNHFKGYVWVSNTQTT